MNKYNIKTTKAFEEELLDIYSYIVDYLQEPKIANEKYKKIRQAQANGARTIDDLKIMTDIVIENDDEAKEMEAVLKNACKCRNVSVEEVAQAVRNGADTVEKVTAATGAGADCDKCKGGVLQSIIKNRG